MGGMWWWWFIAILVGILWIGITVETSIQGVCGGSEGTTSIPINATTSTTSIGANGMEPMHILLTVASSENDSEDLLMAIKTIILHAPVDFPLELHIMMPNSTTVGTSTATTDQSLRRWWRVNEMSQWKTPQPLTFHVYHLSEATVDKWDDRMQQVVQHHRYGSSPPLIPTTLLGDHSLFPLFAHEVLTPHVTRVLHMDIHVLLLANVQPLWLLPPPYNRQVGETKEELFFAWTKGEYIGLVLLHIRPGLEKIWNRLLTPPSSLGQTLRERLLLLPPDDEHPSYMSYFISLLRSIEATAPHHVHYWPDDVGGTRMTFFRINPSHGRRTGHHPPRKDPRRGPTAKELAVQQQTQEKVPWVWVRSQVESHRRQSQLVPPESGGRLLEDDRGASGTRGEGGGGEVTLYHYEIVQLGNETLRRVID